MTRKDKLIQDFIAWGLVVENDDGKRELTDKGQVVMRRLINADPEAIGRKIIATLMKETENKLGRFLNEQERVDVAFHYAKTIEGIIRNDREELADKDFYPKLEPLEEEEPEEDDDDDDDE